MMSRNQPSVAMIEQTAGKGAARAAAGPALRPC